MYNYYMPEFRLKKKEKTFKTREAGCCTSSTKNSDHIFFAEETLFAII